MKERTKERTIERKERTNVYQMVTDRIIAELEKGRIPWERPWTSVRSGAYNRITKKPYSLLNQLILGKAGEWASFKQWQDLGGHVRKGEKASFVTFWKITAVDEEQEDGTMITKQIPLLRYYNVFHISQVEGVDPLPEEELNTEIEPIEEAEKIKNAYKEREHIPIKEVVTNDAGYYPLFDQINVPCREQYQIANEFYSTLFHEMIHSTGHRTRLNRLTSNECLRFRSDTYSKEELTAEFGSAMLMNILGIETNKTFRNSTAYIQSWLKVLKNEPRWIVSASSRAEKAVEYILNGKQ